MVGFNNTTLNASNVVASTRATAPAMTITNAPILGTDGTNKAYVDLVAMGGVYKSPCYCATTANLTSVYNNGASGVGATLTNSGAMAAFSVDGVTPAINSRVLVKDQTTLANNGIYTLTTVGSGAANWVLTRATDYDSAGEIVAGSLVPVEFGTANDSTLWLEIATVVTVGTDPIVFIQFGSGPLVVDQYSVLVGGVNNTVNSVAPSATAGVPLVSNGSSANPSFSTAVVAGGGTGVVSFSQTGQPICGGTTSTGALQQVPAALSGFPLLSQGNGNVPQYGNLIVNAGGTGLTSLTPYAVICGGTTNLGAVQPLSSNGSSGQVLTSTGATSLPTWQSTGDTGASTVNIQVFTNSGNYTPSAGILFAIWEVVGGGAGGGFANNCNSTIQVSAAGGGGAGEYRRGYSSVNPGAQAVTIGGGGTGGFNTNQNGQNGGTSSFGGVNSSGGIGGIYGSANNYISISKGGASSNSGGGGSLSVGGSQGFTGIGQYDTSGSGQGYALGGQGGSGIYGSGGQPNNNASGDSAAGYGGGGAGGGRVSLGTANGGNGSGGIVIITEYLA